MTATPGLLFPTVVIFGSVLLSFLFVALAFSGGRDKRLKRRIARVTGATVTAVPSAPGATIRMVERKGWAGTVELLASRVLPSTGKLRLRLAQTGRPISVGGYIGTSLLLTVGTILFLLTAGPSPHLALLFGTAIGVGVPHFAVSLLAAKRSKLFLSQFPDAIDLMVRGLRSGLPVTEQFGIVGSEMPDPVGAEFRKIAHAIRFGQTLDVALWDASARIGIPDFKFFVVCLAVQRETGGNLAETLQNLSDILRRRRQMRLKVKAMASEASASAMILGALPFIMMTLLFIMNPDYVMILFTDPRGQMMSLVGLVMQGIGVFVMSRMVRFEI